MLYISLYSYYLSILYCQSHVHLSLHTYKCYCPTTKTTSFPAFVFVVIPREIDNNDRFPAPKLIVFYVGHNCEDSG